MSDENGVEIPEDERDITLGTFGRAHGLKGEVRLFAMGSEELIRKGLEAFILRADGSKAPTKLEQSSFRNSEKYSECPSHHV